MKMILTLKMFVALIIMGLYSTTAFASEQYLVKIDGMNCPFCAYGVEKQVRKMEGVEFVAVDLGAGTVAIEMKDGSVLPEKAIEQAIKNAGFSFRSIENVTPDPSDNDHPDGSKHELH